MTPCCSIVTRDPVAGAAGPRDDAGVEIHPPRTPAARKANQRLVKLHGAQLAAFFQAVAEDRVPPSVLAEELGRAAAQLSDLQACATRAYPLGAGDRRWSVPR